MSYSVWIRRVLGRAETQRRLVLEGLAAPPGGAAAVSNPLRTHRGLRQHRRHGHFHNRDLVDIIGVFTRARSSAYDPDRPLGSRDASLARVNGKI